MAPTRTSTTPHPTVQRSTVQRSTTQLATTQRSTAHLTRHRTAPLIADRPLVLRSAIETSAPPPRTNPTSKVVPVRWTPEPQVQRAAQRSPVRPAPPRPRPTTHPTQNTPGPPVAPAYPPVAVTAPPLPTTPPRPRLPTVQRATGASSEPRPVSRPPTPTPTPAQTITRATTKTQPESDDETDDAKPHHAPSRADLDQLARSLIDPVSRLLRAEVRHGRERAGRLHDRRR
ncbi:hypothetical protein [Saccharothrix hoggarensis]|uniref:Syndecan 1 n=1 Tax=Saccharothrix hoggarensis TaxID=913853 RepID=A0ABW3R0U7_9PSEU